MKLEAVQKSNLAANIKGFIQISKQSPEEVGRPVGIAGMTLRNYTRAKFSVMQSGTKTKLAKLMGRPFGELTGGRINWKEVISKVEKADRQYFKIPVRSAANNSNPSPLSNLFTVELPNGSKLSVARGMQISILSDTYVAVRKAD